MGDGFASALSTFCGWTYFIAWSASAYPQIFLNHKRASVQGLSLDFVALNVTGFCAYALYTLCLYALPAASADFFNKRGTLPHIPFNDVVFGVHGAITCVIIVAQCLTYPRGTQSVQPVVFVSCAAAWAAILSGAVLATRGTVSWLGYLNMCGGIKVAFSFVKYVPQVMSNFWRKSTIGFAATGMALDLVGGVFSLAQQSISAAVMHSAAPFSSNPAKTFLAVETLLFDVIFLFQHFFLYPHSAPVDDYGPVASEECVPDKKLEMPDEEEKKAVTSTMASSGSNEDLCRTEQAE